MLMQNTSSELKTENKILKILKLLVKNKVCIGIFIGIVSFAIFATLHNAEFLRNVETVSLEWRFKNAHGKAMPSDKPIIVAIDNKSIEDLGRWPWDRKIFAELVEALNFYKVGSISFDLYFNLPNEKGREGDKLFADTVAKYDNITIGSAFGVQDSKTYYTDKDYKRLSSFGLQYSKPLNAISVKKIFEKLNDNKLHFVYKPYKELFNSMKSLGMLNITAGKEQGKIYSYPLLIEFNDIYLPNLALATYLNHVKTKKVTQEKRGIMINGLNVPVFGYDEYLINWYASKKQGVAYPYDQLSSSDIIKAYRTLKIVSKKTGLTLEQVQGKVDLYLKYGDEKIPKDLEAFTENFPDDPVILSTDDIKGKFAFIGITDQSSGTQDLISTLLIDKIPGVFLHANVLDNFLQKDFITKVPDSAILIVMFIFCIFTGSTVLGLKDPKFAIGIGGVYLLYFLIPIYLFSSKNIYTDMIYTELAIALTFVCSGAFQWIFVDKDKRAFRKTFSNYLSPQVMNEILSDPSKVEMGGDKRDITILFSDIRGFTTISERSTPEDVVKFLNEYFDAMVDEIIKTDGTVDKFIGDAIMAFWGAPVMRENHPELAIRGALGMCKALQKIKKKWADEGKDYPEINIGIGLNSGDAIVGNVGSSKIKSYTVIGDSVNLASRLEGLNKKYANHGDKSKNIIISEYTYERVKDIVEVEYLGKEKVKGKDISVDIYKVISIKGANNEE